MLETWGIGIVMGEPHVKQLSNGGELVTVEVNFRKRRRDTVKNQPLKCKGFGAVAKEMRKACPGQQVLVSGTVDVSEYEYNGKPAKSISLEAFAFAPWGEGTVESASPTHVTSQAPQFSEFSENFEPPF